MYRLNQLGKYADDLASNFTWANTYGLGRALLAMSLLITLCFNDLQALVTPMGAATEAGDKVLLPMAKLGLYQIFPEHLFLIKIFSIIVLVLVISGWRPRITGFFHWWVTFSYTTTAMVVDGGDQIAQIVTLLLIPLCFADDRKWHWTTVPPPDKKETIPFYNKAANLIALTSLFVIQLQVAFIYFHAGVGKLNVEEWVNGTSIFYWIQNSTFGACDTLRPTFIALFSNPYVVTFTTWGVLLLELLLFMAIGLNEKWKSGLLKMGLFFHFGIIIMHGLMSFFFVMAGVLFLYLGPREGIVFSEWLDWFKPKQKEQQTIETQEIPGPSPALSM